MNDNPNRTGAIIQTPFKGYAETTFIGTVVAYSKLSLNDYLAQDKTLSAITWDEFHKLHSEYFHKPFSKITEAEFDTAFSELPPKRSQWLTARFRTFYCAEALSGPFHSIYVYDAKRQRCYAGCKSILLTDREILACIEAEIVEPQNTTEP